LFGCTQTTTTRVKFEDHLREKHNAQFTDAELPTLVDLCQKHQLDNAAAQCPLCSEVVASSEIFHQHLANHMEEFALLSLMPNLPCKFSINVDVVATTSEAAVPDVVQQTSTLDHANISSNANEDDLQTLFSPQPGFQALVLSASKSNPAPTYTVEFTDVRSAFKAAYKLNHHLISMPNSTSSSPNLDSRLSINLINNTLHVRITSDGPPLDAELLPSFIEAYIPTVSISTGEPTSSKHYRTHEQTDQSWWSTTVAEPSVHDIESRDPHT
jgi:hypothetical protein